MVTAIDVKRTDKHLYAPRTSPHIVYVPPLRYLAVDGEGDPNHAPSYAEALELLYSHAYTIKMSKKGDWQPRGYVDFVVPPLEGLWSIVAPEVAFDGRALVDKDQLTWTSIIRMPDFVTDDVVAWARERVRSKKPDLDLSRVYLLDYDEGTCVQAMHVGPFDMEPETVARMDVYAASEGYRVDLTGDRRHHEIYLSDPRKTVQEKLKTIIRHPIVEAGDAS